MNKFEGIIELIVRLVIRRGETILLCLNKESGSYFLPGGHVEFGDTLEDTVYKETHEELGWTRNDIKSIRCIGHLENSYTKKNGSEIHQELNMIYEIEIGDEVEANSQEDHIEFEWIQQDKVDSVTILPVSIVKFLK